MWELTKFPYLGFTAIKAAATAKDAAIAIACKGDWRVTNAASRRAAMAERAGSRMGLAHPVIVVIAVIGFGLGGRRAVLRRRASFRSRLRQAPV